MDANGIAEFLSVARASSFTAGARALGVSVPHASRQVARLEERLGTKLFSRSTRTVRLTIEGEVLFARCEALSDELDNALSEVAQSEAVLEGRLRVAALAGSFADIAVAPAIAELAEENANLHVEVDYNSRVVDILREGFDIAVRSGQMPDSELVATPLASRTLVAAAAPAYLAKHGLPATPADLANHDCIVTSTPHWRFSQNGRTQNVKVRHRIGVNSGRGVIEATRRGLGISYMALAGYEEAFQSGALVPILAPYWLREVSVHIVRANRKFTPLRVDRAIEKLRKYARLAEQTEADVLGPHKAMLTQAA